MLIDQLNPPQQKAVTTLRGPVLILAGAGSGKTRTLTYRMAHMIQNHAIAPENILGVTFTNKASNEMKQRVQKLLGKRASCPTLCTFHALGVKVLREDGQKLGYSRGITIYDQSDQMGLIREALKAYYGQKKFDRKIILTLISQLKNQGISPEQFPSSQAFDESDPYHIACEHAYTYYQDKLKFFNAIDFDDILGLTRKLWSEFPEVAKKYSKRFQYIMVDEFQDTNPIQMEIITHLTSTHQNICVVGDDDQSIYGFRGAEIKNIIQFEKRFPGATCITLDQNYRSLRPILDLANQVIKENKMRRDKKLWSDLKSKTLPELWAMGDTAHEAQVVIDDINKYASKGGHYRDIAILYRSNTQAPAFEDELRMSNTPYTIVGGQKFYEKKEVKDLIAYLSVLQNPADEISLRRILNVPNRGIGQASLNAYLDQAKQQKMGLYFCLQKFPHLIKTKQQSIAQLTHLFQKWQKLFKDLPLEKAIQTLIIDLKFEEYIERTYENQKLASVKKNDLNLFVDSAMRFNKKAKGRAQLQDFLEQVLLQDNQDKNDDDEDAKNQLTLMTLHSSKGLEFKTVYLIGMEEGLLPHSKTIDLGQDIEEERRLAYVGITRAQNRLIMTYAKERKSYGKTKKGHKSRFLMGKQDYFKEFDRNNFGHMSAEETQAYKKEFFQGLLSKI